MLDSEKLAEMRRQTDYWRERCEAAEALLDRMRKDDNTRIRLQREADAHFAKYANVPGL